MARYLQEGSPSDRFDVMLQEANFNDSYSFRSIYKLKSRKDTCLSESFYFLSLSRWTFVIHTVGSVCTHAGARVLINSIRHR